MANLISISVQWLLKNLRNLLIITSLLVAFAWLNAAQDKLATIKEEIATKEQLAAGLQAELQSIQATTAMREAEWTVDLARVKAPLEAELAAIDQQASRAEVIWKNQFERFVTLDTIAKETRRAADVARDKRDALEREVGLWQFIFDRGKIVELDAARAEFVAKDNAAKIAEAARDHLAPSIRNSPVATLAERRQQKARELARLDAMVSPELQELQRSSRQKQADIDKIDALIRAQRERVAQSPAEWILETSKKTLPVAIGILIGAMLVPILIKTVFYFVLAPVASRLPPIRIIPDPSAPAIPNPAPSAVSIPIDVDPAEELLVQPDFLQSSSQPARKRTKWLLNLRIPLASIASGMYALTSIRPEGDRPTRVVISSQKDAFGEIGIIEVPLGAAMIVQPRCLAGVVKPAGVPVDISRHWRLGSLHAWLTLQLRYLAFHGPCKLILKGCRGVRSEEPDPNQPRLINQSATLGFSANLDYKTTRCETFVPYLRGREDLFNDLFGGGPGRFVYEEMPAVDSKASLVSRGLEGLVDTVLKGFGI